MFYFDPHDYPNALEIAKTKYTKLSIDELKFLCNKYNIPLPYQAKKNFIIFNSLDKALNDEKFIQNAYDILSKEQKKIFKYIVNYDKFDLEKDVRKKFNFDIKQKRINGRDKYVWWLELFLDNNQMDPDIKKYHFNFLHDKKLPKQRIESDIEDISKVEITKLSISNKTLKQKLIAKEANSLIENLKIIYTFLKTKKITITAKGELTVRTQKLLAQNLNTDEEQYLWLLNILIELNFISGTKEKIATKYFDSLIKKSDGDIVKELFDKYVKLDYQYEFRYFKFHAVSTRGQYISKFREKVIKLVLDIENNNWINIEYIVDNIDINKNTLTQITNNYIHCYSDNSSYNNIRYLKTVIRYFIKSFIGVLYNFGLANIAETKNIGYFRDDLILIKPNYPGKFTNLEYFKINSLGRYIFGIEDKYSSVSDYQLVLNSYTLDITVENGNNLSDIFLENIATKISTNRYKTDIKTFTKQIDSKKDFLNIKDSFLSKSIDTPQNWIDFFKLLENRIDSISKITSSAILIKLPNDKEILKLISSNLKLRDKIIKADRLHMVILKENLASVKTILKEYGIII